MISIDKQQLTLYSGSEPIARSRVSTGTASHPTPTGVFSVIQKDRWHRSNIYHNAPMFYMQRITWSGVAMHQGIVPNHPASHGCIRLPESFARQLWGLTKMNARVLIARGDVVPAPFAHPRLFTYKQPDPIEEQKRLQQAAEDSFSSEVVSQAHRALETAQAFNKAETANDAAKPGTFTPPATTSASRRQRRATRRMSCAMPTTCTTSISIGAASRGRLQPR